MDNFADDVASSIAELGDHTELNSQVNGTVRSSGSSSSDLSSGAPSEAPSRDSTGASTTSPKMAVTLITADDVAKFIRQCPLLPPVGVLPSIAIHHVFVRGWEGEPKPTTSTPPTTPSTTKTTTSTLPSDVHSIKSTNVTHPIPKADAKVESSSIPILDNQFGMFLTTAVLIPFFGL